MKASLPEPIMGQHQEAEHFHAHWQKLYETGKIDRVLPPDEQIWRRDLGLARRVAFDWLGDLHNKRVLELGCGPGDNTIMLARRGARVTAVDIAPSSLEITRQCACANHVSATVQVSRMPGESLAFPNAVFDWVVGFGFLHHANIGAVGPEMRRVLRLDGRALFFEPLGTNPLLEFVRERVPYSRKNRSPNEHPLTYADIAQVGENFSTTRIREFYLSSMISRVIGNETSFPALWKLDEFLIRRVPAVRRWCRYALVEYR